MPFDRDASRRAESLDDEALAPSDGANTIWIIDGASFKRLHRSRSSEAVARTRSLVLSSVFKERLALSARARIGRWCRVFGPLPARIGRAGRRVNLTLGLRGVNLGRLFPQDFFADAT